MSETVNLPAYIFDHDALRLVEQMRRVQKERERPIETYAALIREVTLTVAVGLNGFDVEMGDVRALAIDRYNRDPMFCYKVKAITAEIMRIFDRYKPDSLGRRAGG